MLDQLFTSILRESSLLDELSTCFFRDCCARVICSTSCLRAFSTRAFYWASFLLALQTLCRKFARRAFCELFPQEQSLDVLFHELVSHFCAGAICSTSFLLAFSARAIYWTIFLRAVLCGNNLLDGLFTRFFRKSDPLDELFTSFFELCLQEQFARRAFYELFSQEQSDRRAFY